MAEVLITLGIIGVVAAMTMPTLMTQHRNQEVEVRLKKFYSVMNQAILMTKKDYGEFSEWYPDYSVEQTVDTEGNYENKNTSIRQSFNKYLAPYLNVVATKDINTVNGLRTLYYFSDGSAFAYQYYNLSDIEYFPKNAEKCLNNTSDIDRYGKCSFMFSFSPIRNDVNNKHYLNKGVEPYMYGWVTDSVDDLLHHSSFGCESGRGSYCTALIQQNGWKIPKDYPRKISY